MKRGGVQRTLSAQDGMDFRMGDAGKVYTIDLQQPQRSNQDGLRSRPAVSKPTLAALVGRKPSVAFPFGNGEFKPPDSNASGSPSRQQGDGLAS